MARNVILVLTATTLGALAVLVYLHFTKHIPSRRDRRQRPRAQWGLVEFTRDDLGTQLRDDGVDVIFVHGLGANPDTTWTTTRPPPKRAFPDEHDKTQERVCWVTDLWIDDIPAEVRRKTRVFFYNHDSGWQRDGVQGRLSTLAGRLLHELCGMTQGSARALVFVAHSYGGLLVKQALVEASILGPEYAHILQQTKGNLFLGTPHRGSNFTTLGSLVALCLRPIGADASILQELDYDSTHLHDLHSHFVRVVKHESDTFTQVFNVFEQRPTVMLQCGTLQWAQLVVRESSATYTGTQYVQNVGIAVDHSGLNKFAARTDEGYQTLRNILRDLLPPQLPPIEVRPISRAPMYTERYELSREIEQHLWPLTDSDDDGFRALVIYGVGGVGKTQLTLQYIEEHRHRYNPIIWLDASTVHSLRHSFQDVSMALKISVEPSPADQEGPLSRSPLVSRVRQWLTDRDEGDARWLVVVDNADEVDHDLKAIIPDGRRGHVIVTSQTQQSFQLFDVRPQRLRVESMQSSEARALLLKRMRVDSRHVSVENQEQVDAIAQRMGCLALAVDMAGAVLAEEIEHAHGELPDLITQETINRVLQQYLRDFDAHRDDMLRYSQQDELSDYQKTVWTVWNTTFSALQKAGHSRALECLILMAHLDGGSTHHELFRLASVGWDVMVRRMAINVNDLVPSWLQTMLQVRDGEWDDYHYRHAVKLLERYVLVQRTEEAWPGTTMHNMIQWRAQKAGEEGRGRWWGWVWFIIVAAAIQTNLDKGRPRFRRHLAGSMHGMAIGPGDRPDLNMVDEAALACGWMEIAEILYDEGIGSRAADLLSRCVGIRKRVLGEEHPDTLTSMNNLASTFGNQGRWKEAEELFVQVMEISSRVLWEEHPDTLTSMNNLASTFGNQGRWKEAEKLKVQVVEIRKRVLGGEHPSTLTSINNLASTFGNQGRWKEAEKLFMQVMEIRKRLLGEEHPVTLTSINNLALTYQNQGRWKEAEELDVQVMEIRKRVLGGEHPSTLTSMNNLASTYRNQGRWKEAENLKVQVMEISVRVLGEEHPVTLTSINNLALTYQNQGRWKEAEELDVQVMEIRKRVLGGEHPSTLTSMNNLASTYRNQGRWKEAENLKVQVMEIRKRVLGKEHPSTLTCMNNLASTFGDQGRWKEAEELFVQVMEISVRVLGEEHPVTLTSMNNLALTYQNQGRWKEAEELFVQVMEIRKRVLGEEHPDMLTSMANLASTYRNQGRWKEAEELEVQVMEIRKRVLGEEHPDMLTSMSNLAHTLKHTRSLGEAMGMLNSCLNLCIKVLGATHPHTRAVVSTFMSWQQEDEAGGLGSAAAAMPACAD